MTSYVVSYVFTVYIQIFIYVFIFTYQYGFPKEPTEVGLKRDAVIAERFLRTDSDARELPSELSALEFRWSQRSRSKREIKPDQMGNFIVDQSVQPVATEMFLRA